jgi:hypothetical protein
MVQIIADDPWEQACWDPCKSDVDEILDTIEASGTVRDGERALLQQGRKVAAGWTGAMGERIANVYLRCRINTYLEYGTFDDGYITITRLICPNPGTGP